MGEANRKDDISGFENEEALPVPDPTDDDDDTRSCITSAKNRNRKEETLYGLVNGVLKAVLSPDPDSTTGAEASLFQRIKISVYNTLPLIPQASTNSTRNLLQWTRQGTALRAMLVISVGTIVLLALTGLLIFMLFFIAATINAIIISLLVSLAAAGGFLAIFLACTTAVYIGMLSVAVFVISSATITTIFAVLIATGWVGFFCAVWIVTKKGTSLAKHSVSMTGSAISAYSTSRRGDYKDS